MYIAPLLYVTMDIPGSDDAKSMIPAKIKLTAKKYPVCLSIDFIDFGLYVADVIINEKRSFVKIERKNPMSGAKIISDDTPPISEPITNRPAVGVSFISFEEARRSRNVIIVFRKNRTSI